MMLPRHSAASVRKHARVVLRFVCETLMVRFCRHFRVPRARSISAMLRAHDIAQRTPLMPFCYVRVMPLRRAARAMFAATF